jgi:hypothetical protein
MANIIDRPTFYEGQILAGADLDAVVDHARGQAARHERYLHSPGIAEGLALTGVDRKTAANKPYKEVSVGAGVAVDSSGREIVVADDTRLSETAFDQSNVWVGQPATADTWYPVFLVGRDGVPAAAPLAVDQCSSEANRVREEFRFDFGRPGDEATAADEPAAAIADGPASGQDTPRRVLLGFVRWDAGLTRFVDFGPSFDGVSRTYAGVRADLLAARGGTLALRTRSQATKGKPGLELGETAGGMLAFGPLTPAGAVEPVFSVNAKGDLTIAGKFTGAVTPGTVHVQSGVASDGVVLPLPPGITQDMLDKGRATAHVHATARVPPSAPPDITHTWLAVPLVCSVDAARRLTCIVRWAANGAMVDLPGECDYLVLVSVAAA